ncbi:MAG: antitoxin [Alkalispirochaeta sp.]
MSMTKTARVFVNGNSQAVRIPREFRLKTEKVEISETDDGDLILHPISDQPEDRAAALLEILNRLDDSDIAAFETAHGDQGTVQERESL